MSSSSLPNTTESDEALARALQDTENAAAVAAAAYDDGYDALPRDALLRELRIRDQELVTAVTEVQLLRANVSKAEELGRNGLIHHPPSFILHRQAFAISAGNRLTPVDLYHDADGNLCLLGRADFSGDVIIHEYRGDGGVGERKDKVVGGLVMWPVDMGDEVDVKGKGKA